MVRPKKKLGQHFLKDQGIAKKIVEALELSGQANLVLEIGPGTGVLTQYLLQKESVDLQVVEIDREAVAYLKAHFPQLEGRIKEVDVLSLDWNLVTKEKFSVIGNFPYNISSQILFKVLGHRNKVDQVVCMLQKEVAERIVSKEGNKVYGILSVLLQAFYDIEFLFKVPPGVFFPPPKVTSAVLRLKRNAVIKLSCNELTFRQVVKEGFQNRRKTLRNALKRLNLPAAILSMKLLDKRAEQLSVQDFIFLTDKIDKIR